MHLKRGSSSDIAFEWILYNQFKNVKKVSNGNYAMIYSAVWKDGPLHYNINQRENTRKPNKRVTLKCLHNSGIGEFLKEV